MAKNRSKKTIHRKWWGVAAGTIGLTASLLGIWQFYYAPLLPEEAVLIDDNSEGRQTRLIDGQISDSIVIEPLVTVNGIVNVPPKFTLVSNSLKFNDGAAFVGTDMLIVSVNISGGKIDASGHDGTSDGTTGTHGQDGGEVVIVGARALGLSIEARGGDGGNGANGANGANGRPGRCDGFGKWKSAQSGGAGGNGGDAGNGGDGGEVFLFGPIGSTISPSIDGGQPGHHGNGGPGGMGGRGCVGLGGSQSSRPNGPPGRDGQAGTKGQEGSSHALPIEFNDFATEFRKLAKSGEPNYDTIRSLAASTKLEQK